EASGSTLTVAPNGVLMLAGDNGTNYYLYGALTNAGTVQLVSGNLGLDTYLGGLSGQLINLPGALVDIQANVSIDSFAFNGTPLIVNSGTVRKSGGTGTSSINPTFDSTGTLDVQTGTVSLDGGYDLS